MTPLQQAQEAFKKWSCLSFEKRAEILLAFAKEVEQVKELFAQLISQETGKPLWDSKNEVQSVIDKIAISLGARELRCPETALSLPSATSHTRYKPHGVALVLGPFNFPVHLPHGHIVPALLAGNTVVFKPSEITPLTAAFYRDLWVKSGLPEGVLQMVQGGREVGEALLELDFQAILFTGSLPVGLKIHEKFARRPDVLLALEMGGNNPLVVSDIDDVKTAAYLTVQSAFLTSGQRCTCARRLILPKSAQRELFLEALVKMTSTLKVGEWHETPEPFMGPVAIEEGAQKILTAYQQRLHLGAHPLLPMTLLKNNPKLLSPALLDTTGLKNLPDEEVFGPLLQIVQVDSFEEAIKEANNTRFGLSAGLLSNSTEEYQQFYREVKAGVINWNTPLTGATSKAPFGGVGLSGNLRPSALFAADYAAYPVASLENPDLKLPNQITPGVSL